jgi:hypothetical protein
MAALEAALAPIALGMPGVRLYGIRRLSDSSIAAGNRESCRYLVAGAMPVRAWLFDKAPEVDWLWGGIRIARSQ